MPPRNLHQGRHGVVRGVFLLVVAWGGLPLAAQELQLQRDYPGSGPFQCPDVRPFAEPTPQDRAQAGQFASDADQAIILGDLIRADQLLGRAIELDPASAELAYRRARVLDSQDQLEDAMLEYCRTLSLGAEDLTILSDSRTRIDALDEILRARISDVARQHFLAGLSQADLGLYPDAVASFTAALDEVSEWPEAVYNRAVVLEAMGLMQESLADYRLYLTLRPTDADPVMALVSERIGMLEGLVAVPTPNPGSTLAVGVLFPGMGHYYSGRSRSGTLVLGAVIGAVATGLFVKEITVRCLNPVPDGGECPPTEVVDETTKRPYLTPAIGIAAGVALVGALEAYVKARRRRAAQEAELESVEEGGVQLSGPSLRSNGDRLDFNLVSLRFR